MTTLRQIYLATIAAALALTLSVRYADAQSHLMDGKRLVPESIPAGAFAAGSIDADDIATSGVATAEILDDTVGFLDMSYTNTIAGNPALGAGECFFEDTGFVCEGATADTVELLITFGDAASSDKTVTVPATTGTLVTTGDTGTVTGTIVLDGTISVADVEGLANTASTSRAVDLLLFRYAFAAADFAANDDIAITMPTGHAMLVDDIKSYCATAEGGAMTATLRTAAAAGGTAMSSAMDLNTTATPQRTTTLAATAVASAATLYLHASGNPGTLAGCVLSIYYSHTD
jgi:hypothetical protein